jgi:hypothetical protein
MGDLLTFFQKQCLLVITQGVQTVVAETAASLVSCGRLPQPRLPNPAAARRK